LKARLYQAALDERQKEADEQAKDKKAIAWGSQIRSYVFQPYTLVKDNRTGQETSNIQAVMDGDIDDFMEAYLRHTMGQNV
jgi:peptide chain release factor 2